jgi:hypothetical protein
LRECITELLRLSLGVLSSNSDELTEMGKLCLRSLVEKFGDKLIPDSMKYFEDSLEGASDATVIGICNGFYQMVDAGGPQSISHHRERILKLITPLLTHDEEEV